jgi:hypothetical protein
VSHASRPCNSTEQHLISRGHNNDSNNHEDGVQERDEAESTGLNWIIRGDSSLRGYANMVVSTLELNPLRNDQTAPVKHEVCIQMKLQQHDAPLHLLLETVFG